MVNLSSFMRSDLVLLDIEAHDKVEIFRKIIDVMTDVKVIDHPVDFLDEIIQRENQASTCIGRGVALPHTRTYFVDKPVIAFARTQHAVSFSDRTLDSVEFIFLLGTPINDPDTYLLILRNLCTLLRNEHFRQNLRVAETPDDVIAMFRPSRNEHSRSSVANP